MYWKWAVVLSMANFSIDDTCLDLSPGQFGFWNIIAMATLIL